MGAMPSRYIGMMSGTSMDGVDAALCEFDGTRFIRVAGSHQLPYPGDLRLRLLQLQREEPALTLRELCLLDNGGAETFAKAAIGLLSQAGLPATAIAAIGSHGQTVFHDPSGVASSVQLGNPSLIAALTGISTVGDFRRADIALKGQGAPLVPAFHHALFAVEGEARCAVNIGGIANVSVMRDHDAANVLGFDTGPGNALMDEWIAQYRHLPYDSDGAWGRSGKLHEGLLNALVADPYFELKPPKSTGRGHFNLAWAKKLYPSMTRLNAADVQRTFCELTARSIVEALQRFAPGTKRVLLCGGGARNLLLCERMSALMADTPFELSDAYGLSLNLVEAAAFAWLAMRTVNGLHGNLPAATGATRAAILGGVFRV